MNLVGAPWFWGLCGAFIYAAPKLSACLFGSAPSAPCARCLVDAAFAIIIGPLAAASFNDSLAAHFGYSAQRDLNASAAVIGLLANPVAPSAIQLSVEGTMIWLKKLLGIDAQ